MKKTDEDFSAGWNIVTGLALCGVGAAFFGLSPLLTYSGLMFMGLGLLFVAAGVGSIIQDVEKAEKNRISAYMNTMHLSMSDPPAIVHMVCQDHAAKRHAKIQEEAYYVWLKKGMQSPELDNWLEGERIVSFNEAMAKYQNLKQKH